MKAWRRVCGPTGLLIPALRARRRTIRPRGVAVESLAVPPEEDRALDPFADRLLDRAGRTRRERDDDYFAALAQHREGAMAAFDTERLDVSAQSLGDAWAIDGKEGHQGMLPGRRHPSDNQERSHLVGATRRAVPDLTRGAAIAGTEPSGLRRLDPVAHRSGPSVPAAAVLRPTDHTTANGRPVPA